MNVKNLEVSKYYGEELESTSDLQTNACCTSERMPKHINDALSLISKEVKNKYYGCGLTIPDNVRGLRILDLGSGSGRDCFIASKLVGEQGFVVGVDMTDAQIQVAIDNINYHTKKFGYSEPNVEFIRGNIENLSELNLEPESFDLIISNCVLNLVTDKQKVFADAYALLKEGGEMYFSDVYSNRRIPKELQDDKVLWGECLSGALYWNDFLRYAQKAGFTDPRVMEDSPITVNNPLLEDKLGDIEFYSVTYRLWKIKGLESDCEDYGQAVRYKGGIEYSDKGLLLDNHHYFPKGKIEPVCGNTYNMLYKTRYKDFFEFFGSWDTHYGIFEGCGANIPFSKKEEESSFGSCC